MEPEVTDIIATKILEGIPFNETFRIRRDVLVSLDEDIMRNEIMVRLQTREIAEKLAEDFYEERILFWEPASTWQMFKRTHKESWWFAWFVRRRPYRETARGETVRIKVDRYALYPDAPDIHFPALGRPIKYETVKRVYKD